MYLSSEREFYSPGFFAQIFEMSTLRLTPPSRHLSPPHPCSVPSLGNPAHPVAHLRSYPSPRPRPRFQPAASCTLWSVLTCTHAPLLPNPLRCC